MDEARKRSGIFNKVVGTVKRPPGDRPTADEEVRGPWAIKTPQKTKQRTGVACVLQKEADTGYKAREITFVNNASREYAANSAAIYSPSYSPLGGFVNLTVDKKKPRLLGLHAQCQSQYCSFLNPFVALIFGCISLPVVGLIRRSRKGNESTEVKRGFAISWLVIGMLFISLERPISSLLLDIRGRLSTNKRGIGLALIYGAFLVPRIRKLAVICGMIVSYETCTMRD